MIKTRYFVTLTRDKRHFIYEILDKNESQRKYLVQRKGDDHPFFISESEMKRHCWNIVLETDEFSDIECLLI